MDAQDEINRESGFEKFVSELNQHLKPEIPLPVIKSGAKSDTQKQSAWLLR